MTRYVQRISLIGSERWIGWEIDGVGTDIPGMTCADEFPPEELQRRGVREYRPLPFENAIEMGRAFSSDDGELVDEDLAFRLDAIMVGLECLRMRGMQEVPRSWLASMLGERRVSDRRVMSRFAEWIQSGCVELVCDEKCYLRIRGRLA